MAAAGTFAAALTPAQFVRQFTAVIYEDYGPIQTLDTLCNLRNNPEDRQAIKMAFIVFLQDRLTSAKQSLRNFELLSDDPSTDPSVENGRKRVHRCETAIRTIEDTQMQ